MITTTLPTDSPLMTSTTLTAAEYCKLRRLMLLRGELQKFIDWHNKRYVKLLDSYDNAEFTSNLWKKGSYKK